MVKYLAGPRSNEVLRYIRELKERGVLEEEKKEGEHVKRTRRTSRRSGKRSSGKGTQTQLPF